MKRQDLREVQGWTVVASDGLVNHVLTFDAALKLQGEVGGQMMTTEYYNFLWKPIHE